MRFKKEKKKKKEQHSSDKERQPFFFHLVKETNFNVNELQGNDILLIYIP